MALSRDPPAGCDGARRRDGRVALHGARGIAAADVNGPHPGDLRHCREVLRRLPALHEPQQHRVPPRGQTEGGPAAGRAGPEEIPRRRDRARHIEYRPHPGVGALPHAGHGRLRPREGIDGRDLRVLRDDEAAQPCADRAGLLPEHVRRRPLLRHRHPGHPPDGPQDRTIPAFRTSAKSRPRWPPAPRAPSAGT